MPDALIPFSQNNPEWANVVYAGNLTFRTAGCLVCDIASVHSRVALNYLTPPEVAAALREAGAFIGGFLSRPSRIPDALPNLTWGGVIHWRNIPADIPHLAELVDTHGPIIAEVLWNPALLLCYQTAAGNTKWNQHFVVVTEVDGPEVTIMDPWDGEFKQLRGSRYMQPHWGAARGLYGLRLIVPAMREK